MSLKKILIILIILLVLILGVLVVYNFFLKEKEEISTEPSTTPTTSPTTPSQTTQDSLHSRIKIISQEPVLEPAIDNQKVKYYLKSNGNVFESNFDGSESNRISSSILPGISKTIWSPNKNKVIIILEENGLLKKYLYDFQTEKLTSLDQSTRYIVWSPIEDKIVYQYYDSQTEDNNISIANPDGSQWTNVLQTRMKNLIIEWPSPNKISLRTKPSGLAQSVIYTIDLITNNLQKILKETYGLTALWSPLGDKLLFSETNDQGKNLKLKIADFNKQTIGELDFVTLPEKCAWSQDNRTIFCAIPKNVSDSAVLPDDYYKGLVSFADDFWRINLDTGEATRIFQTTEAFDAGRLLLSPLEDYLLFIDKKNGLLYSLEL